MYSGMTPICSGTIIVAMQSAEQQVASRGSAAWRRRTRPACRTRRCRAVIAPDDDQRVDQALVERRQLERLLDVVEERAGRQQRRRRRGHLGVGVRGHHDRVVEREDRDERDSDDQRRRSTQLPLSTPPCHRRASPPARADGHGAPVAAASAALAPLAAPGSQRLTQRPRRTMITNIVQAVAEARPSRSLVQPCWYISRPSVWYWFDVPPSGRPLCVEQRLAEQLGRADRRDHDREQDRRPQPGQRDVAELLPAAGAVDRRGLVERRCRSPACRPGRSARCSRSSAR